MKKLLTLLLTLTSPLIAHDGDHSEAHPDHTHHDQPVQTGNGLYTFSTVPGWGVLPDGQALGPTHGGVAVDGSGRTYVSTDAEHGICVFEKDGTFSKSFGAETQRFHSLAITTVDGKEVLYGANGGGQYFAMMDLEGNTLLRIPNENTGEVPGATEKHGPFKGITGAAITADGHIFIANGYGNNLIHKFDAAGRYLTSMGGRSTPDDATAPEKFKTCHGLAIDHRFDAPRLLVVDRENGRLVHFDLDFSVIGVHAEHLRRPCAVSFHGDECAVAELAGRVTIVDPRGAPVAFLGDNPDETQRANFKTTPEEMKPGIFTAPHGLAYDAEGNLIVQDWNATGRVTFLKRAGGTS